MIMYHNFINITPTVLFKLQCLILKQMAPLVTVGRCGVVGSTLAFGSVGHRVRLRAPLNFTSQYISLQQAEITGEVLTGRFSSSTAVVHSASYPPGTANRVAAYQWVCWGLTQRSRQSFAYTGSSFPIR